MIALFDQEREQSRFRGSSEGVGGSIKRVTREYQGSIGSRAERQLTRECLALFGYSFLKDIFKVPAKLLPIAAA